MGSIISWWIQKYFWAELDLNQRRHIANEFTVRPAAIDGIYSQLEEDRVIETRALPCTPGVQAQFATLAVPSISADGETPTLTSEDICS